VDASLVEESAKPKAPLSASEKTGLAVGCILAAAIGWSFHTSFADLIDRWARDDNYSHGWLIIPIALAILWQRRERLALIRLGSRWWNFIPLAALVAVRVVLYQRNEQWAEMAMIPAVVAAIFLALGGWSFLRWALPGVIFLFFMVPLPSGLNDSLAGPLQSVATLGSVNLLQTAGFPALSQGNVILIGNQHLEVARACRGLSMLLSFGALITAMVILIQRPLWERLVLIASIIPIALLCNIIRIAVTAVIYSWKNRSVQEVHEYAGYAMMVMALGLVTLEMMIMNWLVVDETTNTPSLLKASYSPPPGLR
jgi:exosortase